MLLPPQLISTVLNAVRNLGSHFQHSKLELNLPSNSLSPSYFRKVGQSNHFLILTSPRVYIDFELNWHTVMDNFLRACTLGIHFEERKSSDWDKVQ